VKVLSIATARSRICAEGGTWDTSKSATIITRPPFEKCSQGSGANRECSSKCLIHDLLIRHSRPGVPSCFPAFTSERGKREAQPIRALPFEVIMLWKLFGSIRRISRIWPSDIGIDIGMSGYGRQCRIYAVERSRS